MKVSDYIIKCLEDTGSEYVFMLPGGGAMHLNDSLGKSEKLKFVCCQKESGCSIAAESYARASGKIGLVMVTTGPGGTNALTGVAAAYVESTPMIIISGQVKTADMINTLGLRQQGMQELDIVSVVKPITKYAVCVKDPSTIEYHMDKALYEATHGRKGPVWVDVPLDVQSSQIKCTVCEVERSCHMEQSVCDFECEARRIPLVEKQVEEVIARLNEAKRPCVLLGGGIRLAQATDLVDEFTRMLNVPVLTSWNGIDLVTEDNPLYFGRPGGLGHRFANFIQQNSDFFLSVGCRLNLLQTGYNFDGFARGAYRVMVDIDPAELKKTNVRPSLAICSDARDFMECLLAHKKDIKSVDRSEWFTYARKMKEKYPIILDKYRKDKKANTYILVDKISDIMESGDVYVSGSSGSSIDISMQALKIKKGVRAYATKGMASMGYALPSTIGAALASGGRVYSVTGDGGFVMNMQELETIHRLNLPIKIFVLCNGGYGAIRATQKNIFAGHFVACGEDSGLTLPDIKRVVSAFDIKTYEIYTNDEMDEKLEEIKNYKEPLVCCVYTDISLTAMPKQVSYKRSDGQMESLPLEYMNPPLNDEEMKENMLIPEYEKK